MLDGGGTHVKGRTEGVEHLVGAHMAVCVDHTLTGRHCGDAVPGVMASVGMVCAPCTALWIVLRGEILDGTLAATVDGSEAYPIQSALPSVSASLKSSHSNTPTRTDRNDKPRR